MKFSRMRPRWARHTGPLLFEGEDAPFGKLRAGFRDSRRDPSASLRAGCRRYGLRAVATRGNLLQVVGDCYVLPAGEESANAVGDGAADFHHEITAGLEGRMGGGDQLLDHFEASWSGEDGAAGLEFAYFELDLVFFDRPT